MFCSSFFGYQFLWSNKKTTKNNLILRIQFFLRINFKQHFPAYSASLKEMLFYYYLKDIIFLCFILIWFVLKALTFQHNCRMSLILTFLTVFCFALYWISHINSSRQLSFELESHFTLPLLFLLLAHNVQLQFEYKSFVSILHKLFTHYASHCMESVYCTESELNPFAWHSIVTKE